MRFWERVRIMSFYFRELAAKLEVDPNSLWGFTRRRLRTSLDLSIQDRIALLEDPWLELGTG